MAAYPATVLRALCGDVFLENNERLFESSNMAHNAHFLISAPVKTLLWDVERVSASLRNTFALFEMTCIAATKNTAPGLYCRGFARVSM